MKPSVDNLRRPAHDAFLTTGVQAAAEHDVLDEIERRKDDTEAEKKRI